MLVYLLFVYLCMLVYLFVCVFVLLLSNVSNPFLDSQRDLLLQLPNSNRRHAVHAGLAPEVEFG